MLRHIFFLSILLLTVSAASGCVLCSTTPIATINSSDFTVTSLYLGEKILIRTDVRVSPTSPSPLNGFCVYYKLVKPSREVLSGWACNPDTYQPGERVRFNIVTGITADEVGKWGVYVDLYTYDKQIKLSSDYNEFTVISYAPSPTPTPTPYPYPSPSPTPSPTPPSSTIETFAGAAAITAASGAGLFLLWRRFL